MVSDADRIKEYRKRAQDARAMARGVMPPDHRAGLISIAESYDRLAGQLEATAKRSSGPISN